MTADEKITQWLAELRAASRAVLLARFVIAAAGTAAIVLPTVQPWDQMDLVLYLAVPLLLATVVLPDSVAATLFLFVITLGWLMRAPTTITWALPVTAMALATVHLAAAFAAQLPSYARVHPTALRRWWLPGTIALLLAPTASAAAALIQHANITGSLLVTVAAISLTTTTLWLVAGQRLNRD
ncbi:hypothetical protein [Kribbella sp. NPDC004536]|uniref:hypothetical protein n=1 Tax=Kribbella sp. NPDC004536 TaxID=3364106 RepID=UPI00368A0E03